MFLHQLTHGLTQRQAKDVEIAYNQALAYVWGRQDAGEGERDTTLSEHFASAFAEHVHAFVTERAFVKTNLQSAYMAWRDSGTINA